MRMPVLKFAPTPERASNGVSPSFVQTGIQVRVAEPPVADLDPPATAFKVADFYYSLVAVVMSFPVARRSKGR
jgi:hypothetical protein